jgi:hypothetical protein
MTAVLTVGVLTVVALAVAGVHDDSDTTGSTSKSDGMHDPFVGKSIPPDEPLSRPCFNAPLPGDHGVTASLDAGTGPVGSTATAESGATGREVDPLLTSEPSVGMLLSEGLWGSDLDPITCSSRLRNRVVIAGESSDETTITSTHPTPRSAPSARSVDRG